MAIYHRSVKCLRSQCRWHARQLPSCCCRHHCRCRCRCCCCWTMMMMRMGMRVERRAAETAVTRCLVSRVNVSCPCVRYLMKLCVGLNADSERWTWDSALWTSWHRWTIIRLLASIEWQSTTKRPPRLVARQVHSSAVWTTATCIAITALTSL